MKNAFEAFPELLFIDATYKLNDLRMPLYLLMIVDGCGESELVGIFLAADEDADTIREMITFFKKHNSKWQKIECIMSDKDMTERNILIEEIPLKHLCKFACFIPYVRFVEK